MLIGEPTKFGAGITLYGDSIDLENLWKTIHDLSDGIPLGDRLSDFVLGLAYDIRHAYQGDRKIKYYGYGEEDRTKYFGVDILWPYFLVQLGLLRWSAGFHPTSYHHQADLFRLEAITEKALITYDPIIGIKCFDWLKKFSGFPDNYLLEYINDATWKYVYQSKGGKTRFSKLPEVLLHFSSISPFYTKFEEQMESIAKQKGCEPHELELDQDWPNFNW